MVKNAPFHATTHDGLTIEGYSRAAVQTYWRIPELNLGFDLGGQPFHFARTPNWFISHCHLDHIAALPVLVARRRMLHMSPPRIFLPKQNVDDVERLLHECQRLDRHKLPRDLVALSAGDEIELTRDHVVSAFATRHTLPSLGFLVWQRSHKLEAAYHGLASQEVSALRASGNEVTGEIRCPLLCYVGDTAPAGLDHFPPLYKARVLITEVTFVDPGHSRDSIHKYGHVHLDDLLARAERFENELIIVSHLTARTTGRRAQRQLDRQLPAWLKSRVQLWT